MDLNFTSINDAWVMIRPSGTEPVLRVYSEAADMDKVNDILSQTVATLSERQPVS